MFTHFTIIVVLERPIMGHMKPDNDGHHFAKEQLRLGARFLAG